MLTSFKLKRIERRDDLNRYTLRIDCNANNNEAWHLMHEIFDWLTENNVDYSVYAFQCNQLMLDITNEEDMALVKLTFEGN